MSYFFFFQQNLFSFIFSYLFRLTKLDAITEINRKQNFFFFSFFQKKKENNFNRRQNRFGNSRRDNLLKWSLLFNGICKKNEFNSLFDIFSLWH